MKQCCAPHLERRTLPEPEILNRFEAARLLFIFGMSVSSQLCRPRRLIPAVHGSGLWERSLMTDHPSPVKPGLRTLGDFASALFVGRVGALRNFRHNAV